MKTNDSNQKSCASALENFTLFFAVFFLFATMSLAQNKPVQLDETRDVPANFVSDGCSSFPDGDYFDCCFEHDKAYYAGGSWTQRWRADKKLYKCVAAKKGFQHKFIAPVMWLGVRAFGVPFLPTPFRWGFGKDVKKKAKKKSGKTETEKSSGQLISPYFSKST